MFWGKTPRFFVECLHYPHGASHGLAPFFFGLGSLDTSERNGASKSDGCPPAWSVGVKADADVKADGAADANEG
eukprot:5437995-Pyramimonas_sp.AAC.1